jgi:hypothetical protein
MPFFCLLVIEEHCGRLQSNCGALGIITVGQADGLNILSFPPFSDGRVLGW